MANSVGWRDLETSPDGSMALLQVPDYDPSHNGAGHQGTRVFLAKRSDATSAEPLPMIEIQLADGVGEIVRAHFINGQVMVVYQTNPEERDYEKRDLRVIYVPVEAL